LSACGHAIVECQNLREDRSVPTISGGVQRTVTASGDTAALICLMLCRNEEYRSKSTIWPSAVTAAPHNPATNRPRRRPDAKRMAA
jgi:hypothetical protein